MYEPDTILKLKKPRSTDDAVFPYDKVRVVNRSPINHSGTSDWEGADAEGVIIQPLTGFDANSDEPFGKLAALYDVAELPDTSVDPESQKIRVVDTATAAAGKTPEEVFAEEAPGEPGVDGKRGRTPRESPLEDPRPAPSDGPLGDVKPNES